MEEKFVCPRCGNDDPRFVGLLNGTKYCRKCIVFKGEDVEYEKSEPRDIECKLDFSLSEKQKEISKRVNDNYFNKKNTLIYAVTGAGKTEIVYELIANVLRLGETIGFAIPRKDVVIELMPRLCKAFPKAKVAAVYGGHHQELKGDIVLLTTHQLFRYVNYFDLLIVDEIDAFPYQNNEVLINFFQRSLRSNFVMMSATPSEQIKNYFLSGGNEMLTLFSRFHKHPLPVPKVKKCDGLLLYFFLFKELRKFYKAKKPVLVFAPTIKECEKLGKKLQLAFKNIDYVHSKRKEKDLIVDKFRKNELNCLVTTSILERGITINNLQVIVMFANHKIYTIQTLIQIAGRVGRNINNPDGEVWFFTNKINEDIRNAISEIKTYNQDL